jgi:hypothetical protein
MSYIDATMKVLLKSMDSSLPSAGMSIFFMAKLPQKAKRKFENDVICGRFQSPKVRKNDKNGHISIVGFQCLSMRIEV